MQKLILHLGAHRCGSTAVQTVLTNNRDRLAAADITVVLRGDMIAGTMDLRRLHRFRRLAPRWIIKLRDIAAQAELMTARHVILSEENLMGTMPGVRSFGFYPHFGRLVRGLAALHDKVNAGGRTVEVAPRLIVRRQDRFIESVYAFRVSRGLTLGFEEFVAKAAAHHLSWLRMATLFEQYGPMLCPKFALLEGWPKASSAGQAFAFLDVPPAVRPVSDRLTGNHSNKAIETLWWLAMNRAVPGWQEQARFDALAAYVEKITLTLEECTAKEAPFVLMEILQDNADLFTLDERAALKPLLENAGSVRFSDGARAAFLSEYQEENDLFCVRPDVVGDCDLWHLP